jgi:hypothetical protein
MNPRAEDGDFAAGARAFVRALWGLELRITPLPASTATTRTRFLGAQLWLPSTLPPGVNAELGVFQLAAAAHAAAHLRFSGARFLPRGLKPIQVALISLLEDARVERLACREYPGLFRLWAPFFEPAAPSARTSAGLLARLAHGLHTGTGDPDSWVNEARKRFFTRDTAVCDPNFVRELGGRLGNELGQMRLPFDARDYAVTPVYRDDHFGLWQLELESAAEGAEIELKSAEARWADADSPASRTPSSSNPVANGAASAFAVPTRGEPEYAESPALSYPEWDYVIRHDRAAFCTLREKPAPKADPKRLDESLSGYTGTRRRLLRAASRLAAEQRMHQRRLTSGPRLDLRAAIAASLSPVVSQASAPRVYQRTHFRREPPALLVLLDCSESLNAVPRGLPCSALELARRASALLGSTLNAMSRDWAIHGFNSNGRKDVGYFRFKDFGEPYDVQVRARLAGMRAGLSTRLGTALRHAGQALHARRARRKVLLVVTDGEPSDVDVHDPEYLGFDAQRATRENRMRGVTSFCIGLGSSAESRIRAVFGSHHFLLIDRLERLPERLSRLSLCFND